MAAIKHILLDWSGTLYNDFNVSHVSTRHTVRRFGGPNLSKEVYRERFNLPVWKFYREHGVTVPIDEIDAYYFDHFEKIAHRAKLYKGVRQALALAKKFGTNLYIFSTVRQSLLEELCRREKILPYFTKIFGSVRDKERMLPQLMRRYGFKKKDTLFIGDMEHDVTAAKKSGVLSGAFLDGYHSTERLLQHMPDFVFNDYEGVAKLIRIQNTPIIRGRATHRAAPTATVGALIRHNDEIFLIQTHKWGHTFGIPGGKIKYGESSIAALKREIREETGLSLKNIRFAVSQDSIRSKEFYKPGSHFILLNYTAEATSRKFKLNDEAEAGIWVKPKLALKLRLNEPTRVLIQQIIK